MYLEDIPFFSVFGEVEEKVTDIVLSESDAAELMSYDDYGIQDIYELYGTGYEDIIPALISFQKGENWGMFGNIYKFRLSTELIKHIKRVGICNSFQKDGMFLLDNLCLLKGDKVIYSCVTHEVFQLYHMAEIDDSIADKIKEETKKTIEDMPLYARMQAINDKLSAKSEEVVKRELCILHDLHCYVDREKGAWFYQKPAHECSFKEFKKIAKQYLTAETYSALGQLTCFAQLHPESVAKTTDEVLSGKFKGSTQFLKSEYYGKVVKELCMLNYVRK